MNIISTHINGIYNRNDEAWNHAELYKDSFDIKDIIVDKFENVANLYLLFRFPKKSMWNKKANFFSLFVALLSYIDQKIDIDSLRLALNNFEPDEIYKNAAKEGVNNAKERTIRNSYIDELISSCLI